jgi:hypothetical protein
LQFTCLLQESTKDLRVSTEFALELLQNSISIGIGRVSALLLVDPVLSGWITVDFSSSDNQMGSDNSTL